MVAEAKQRIIGSMAVILVPLKVGDQVTRGSHGIDLMVHPDYRRLGIMKRLGTKCGPCLNVRILDPNIPKELATNPANWYYVVGDGDSL